MIKDSIKTHSETDALLKYLKTWKSCAVAIIGRRKVEEIDAHFLAIKNMPSKVKEAHY